MNATANNLIKQMQKEYAEEEQVLRKELRVTMQPPGDIRRQRIVRSYLNTLLTRQDTLTTFQARLLDTPAATEVD